MGAGLFAALAALSITNYGPGMSPDAATYIAGARNLAAGEGYLGFAGEPVVRFPPGFPSVVALSIVLGFDEIAAAGWLNVAFAATAVLLGAYVVNGVVTITGVRILSLALVSLSVPLLLVSTFVLSEALFILLTMATLVALRTVGVRSDVIFVAGILSGVATATRYVGVTLVATGVLWIWLGLADRSVRVRKILWFLGSAGLVVMPLVVRNYLVAGSLGGDFPSAINGLLTNLKILVASLVRFFVPETIPLTLGAMILVPVAAYLLWRSVSQRVWSQIHIRDVGPFVLFVGVYLLTLLVLELVVAIDPPTVRFLAPIYLPLVIIGSAGLDALLRAERNQSIHRTAVVLAVSFLVAGAALSVTSAVKGNLAGGPGGYSSPEWGRAELVSLVNDQPAGWADSYVEIYSNDPWAAYLLNNLVALQSASETKRLSDEPGLPRQAMCLDGSENLLVWYQAAKSRTYLYTLADLEQICVLEPVLIASDGIVALLLPRE